MDKTINLMNGKNTISDLVHIGNSPKSSGISRNRHGSSELVTNCHEVS